MWAWKLKQGFQHAIIIILLTKVIISQIILSQIILLTNVLSQIIILTNVIISQIINVIVSNRYITHEMIFRNYHFFVTVS